MTEKLGLKQLFDEESSTYTYLIWDQSTKDSILVDPVDVQVDRDLKEVQDLGLNLKYGGKMTFVSPESLTPIVFSYPYPGTFLV